MKITEGVVKRPKRIGIYGPEGIGKTTLISQLPNLLIMDTEGGSVYMNVRRIMPSCFEEVMTVLDEIAKDPTICENLAIDTADKIDEWAAEYVCRKHNMKGIESFGYGKGYVFVGEAFSDFLKALERVLAGGIGVVITAHSKLRKFEQPEEMGAYDRYEMKLSKQSAPLLKEWLDALFFCNYKTLVVNSECGKAKAQGGKRVMYTSHHPCWDAKNRFGLPDEMPLSYESIRTLFEAGGALEALKARMETNGVEEKDLQSIVAAQGLCPAETPVNAYPEKVCNWAIKNWPVITNILKKKER